MGLHRYNRVFPLLLLTVILVSLLSIVWHSQREPLVRRLTWLSRPGAYAIYISQETDHLVDGSIRMMVLGGNLVYTTIQLSTLNESAWTEWLVFANLPIQSSTSFWVANDVRIGGNLYVLHWSAPSTIEGIWYDYDEADEGNSGQRVICLRSNTSAGERFSCRFAVGCGLVTEWWYSGCYHLYQTDIFPGVYTLFWDMEWIIAVALLLVGITMTLRIAVKRAIQAYNQE